MSTALLRSPPEFRRGERERGGEERSKEAASPPPSAVRTTRRAGRCVLSLDDKKRKARSRTITPRGSDLGLHEADGGWADGRGRGKKEASHCDSLLRPVGSTPPRNLGRAKENGRTERGGPSFLPFWPRLALFLLPRSSRFRLAIFLPSLRSAPLRSPVAVIYTQLIFCNFLPTSEASGTREHRVIWQIGRHVSVAVCDNTPKAYCN